MQFLREGEQAAFTEIYRRYNKQVYRYLISLVKMAYLAEDLVHEVFLKLWEARERLEIRDNFSGYLFRICHNKAYDAMVKIARERDLQAELLNHYPLFPSGETHTLEELQEMDNLVEQALSSLPPQRRKVYELCKRQGKSYQEAATELGITVQTVKDHMKKALAALRVFLQNKGKLALIFYLSELIFKKS